MTQNKTALSHPAAPDSLSALRASPRSESLAVEGSELPARPSAEEITRDEWQRRYAARLMERGGMNEIAAIKYAPDIYDQTMKDSPDISPEDAAHEEMSCWEDTK